MKFKSLFLLPTLLVSSLVGLASCSENSDQTLVDDLAASSVLLINGKGDPVYSDKEVNATFDSHFLALTRQEIGDKEIKIEWTSDAPADKPLTITADPNSTKDDPTTSRSKINPWYGYHETDKYVLKLTANLSLGNHKASTVYTMNMDCADTQETTIADINKQFIDNKIKKNYKEFSGFIQATYDNAKSGLFVADGDQSILVAGGKLGEFYDAETMKIGTKINVIGIPLRMSNNYQISPVEVKVKADSSAKTPVNVTVTKAEDITTEKLSLLQGRVITAKNITYDGLNGSSKTEHVFKYDTKKLIIKKVSISGANKSTVDSFLATLVKGKAYDVTFAMRWNDKTPEGAFVVTEGKTIAQSIVEHVA